MKAGIIAGVSGGIVLAGIIIAFGEPRLHQVEPGQWALVDDVDDTPRNDRR